MFLRWMLIFVAACDTSSTMSKPPGRDGMLTFEEDMATPFVPDLAVPEDLSIVEDLSLLPEDLMASSRGDMAGSGGCNVKVNELLLSTLKGTTSRASEEYVELFNPCSTSKSLKNWSLRYRSAGNNSKPSNPDTPLVQNIGKTIPAMGYLLFSGTQYTGSHDGSLVNGLSDAGGAVALVDDNNDIVDSVAYGSADANNNFAEGQPAPLPPQSPQPGKVVARSPNGTDTDDNSADFQVQDPTPKAPNT
jgi:hypothetical protein